MNLIVSVWKNLYSFSVFVFALNKIFLGSNRECICPIQSSKNNSQISIRLRSLPINFKVNRYSILSSTTLSSNRSLYNFLESLVNQIKFDFMKTFLNKHLVLLWSKVLISSFMTRKNHYLLAIKIHICSIITDSSEGIFSIMWELFLPYHRI